MSRPLPINDPYKQNVDSKVLDVVVYPKQNDNPVYYPTVKVGK